MRGGFLYLLILACIAVKAQDKVFLLDGTWKKGKVLEISTDGISMEGETKDIFISRTDIAVIEFANGTFEIVNEPPENLVYNTVSVPGKPDNKSQSLHKPHYVALNSLALYNADLSIFYEYVPKSKSIGVGFMGAYNFNPHSTLPNIFITPLHNSKKNYDLGATFNIYPGNLENKTSVYFGMMFKYTSFNFSKTRIDSVITSTSRSAIISYSATTGHQLATIFTLGTHTKFGDNFFIKTLAGLGAFRLKGDYKDEFNKSVNENRKSGQAAANYNYLPKFYFGIHLGFTL